MISDVFTALKVYTVISGFLCHVVLEIVTNVLPWQWKQQLLCNVSNNLQYYMVSEPRR